MTCRVRTGSLNNESNRRALSQLVEASVAAAESDDRDTAADEGDGKRGKRGGGRGQLGDLGKFILHGDSAGHDAEIARARARAASYLVI